MFALISDIAACEAHNNGKLTVYLPTRPLNYNVKYSYLLVWQTLCSCEIKLRSGVSENGWNGVYGADDKD